MGTFTYAAALALIRVIERAGIDEEWDDFCRAYKIGDVGVQPPTMVVQGLATVGHRPKRG